LAWAPIEPPNAPHAAAVIASFSKFRRFNMDSPYSIISGSIVFSTILPPSTLT
jgi:hypothetical protein